MLDEAIRLFENAKKMVAATALDLISPNKCHWGRIDEKVTKFVSSLGKVDYDKAIEAHQKGKYVRALGEVKLNGESQYLECTSFEIIE